MNAPRQPAYNKSVDYQVIESISNQGKRLVAFFDCITSACLSGTAFQNLLEAAEGL